MVQSPVKSDLKNNNNSDPPARSRSQWLREADIGGLKLTVAWGWVCGAVRVLGGCVRTKPETPLCPQAQTGISCASNLKTPQLGASTTGGSARKTKSSLSTRPKHSWRGRRVSSLGQGLLRSQAAHQAPRRAGSQEWLQRAGSWEASGNCPLISLAVEGSHILPPQWLFRKGLQRLQSP